MGGKNFLGKSEFDYGDFPKNLIRVRGVIWEYRQRYRDIFDCRRNYRRVAD